MDLSLLGMLSAAGGGSSSSKKADGNPVVLDGLQGGVPFNRVEVSGKNLMPYPYSSGDSYTSYGITFTVNPDKSITANGTFTGSDGGRISYNIFDNSDKMMIKAGTYTLSGLPNPESITTSARIVITFADGTNSIIYNEKGGKYTFTLSENKAINSIYIRWYLLAGTVFDNVIFKPQLEFGDTATEYEPPITGREMTAVVCGKNLIPFPYNDGVSKTLNGITYTVNSDGSVTVDGTATADSAFYFLRNHIFTFINTDLFLSGCPNNGSGNTYDLVIAGLDTNGNVAYANNDVGTGKKINLPSNTATVNVYIRIRSGQTVKNLVFRPQLEYGDTTTDYEPYHGAEYTITPDSNPYTVPVDITQYDDINVLSIVDDSNPTISVNANKASEQLSTIYRTLNNKPVLLFDGNVPTSSSAGYAEFTIDKRYSALIIVPICNDSNVYEPGACTVIPIGYMTEEEQGFTAYGYPRAVQRVNRALIKRVGNTIYLRSPSTACNRMTIYGI